VKATQLHLGVTCFGQGKYDQAIEHYLHALDIRPARCAAHDDGAARARSRFAPDLERLSETRQLRGAT